MKAYIMVRNDLANAAAVETYVAANPTNFTKGTIILPADGTMLVVTAAGVTKLVTVGEPTP